MKKKIIIFVVIVIAVLGAFLYNSRSSLNYLKEIDITQIQAITIYNPSSYYTITEQEDIQVIFDELKSLDLKRELPNGKDGFSVMMDINLKNAEKIEIIVRMDEIIIDGQQYKSKENYHDKMRELFELFSQKYKMYEA